MMRTLFILLRKEFILFRKNKFLPKIAFIFPCMVILVIPLVATMDVKHVGVTIVSRDNSKLTSDIIADLEASPFFSVSLENTYDKALDHIEGGTTDVILEIPSDFQKNLETCDNTMPHIRANGVNGTKGTLGAKYVTESVMRTIAEFRGVDIPDTTTISYLYNPTLEYRNYMIPALMIMLLIMICGFLPALNLVSEKETGTIEQMNVTPVKTYIFVLSKVIPYWIIGIIDISLAMLIAFIIYGLTPAGSLLAIYLAALLFIFVMSGIGIIIANFSSKMSQSMFLMLFVVLLCVLMSGLLTPISSMPDWAQYSTYALPPRYFIEIMRSVYLKATAISDLEAQYAALLGFAIIINSMAALTYKKQR
ncbi:ABC transporter permease [uncultured Duncaniella sp.]|uniref:ABC transporter permease n=1 Tax=uncultured Duncaniella sp. TaxID=2768039 RepID=UPI002613AC62|nr:ABC transporter permease [uncultured Duncaniella sp.]